MDVAIFGAGVAGLMTAITLSARGHRCRLYERWRKNHEAGMGFILVPDGIKRLQELGVHLTGEFSGTRLEHYRARDSAGKILEETAMPAGARGIRRRDLIAALVRTVSAGGTSILDDDLKSVEFDQKGRVRAAHLNQGGRLCADLYVGAEGIHSRTRLALFPDWPTSEAQVPEVVGLVRSPQTIRWAANNFNKLHAPEGGIAVGILPVDSEHVIWFLQFDARRFPPPPEEASACRDFAHNLIGAWAAPIPHLLAETDFARVHVWRPVDTDLIPRFSRENLALVGDAAHPLLPFTSQGVSSAVGDAVALAEFISGQDNLDAALTAYSVERRRECAPFIEKGRELMQWFLKPQGRESMVLPIA